MKRAVPSVGLVLERLVVHGVAVDGEHARVVACAQRIAHRILVIREQAGPQLAVRSQAQAVAAVAEVVGHRRDEAHGTLRARKSPILCRAGACRRVLTYGQKRADPGALSGFGDLLAKLIGGHDVRHVPGFRMQLGGDTGDAGRAVGLVFAGADGLLVADGHVLDEADVHRSVDREPGEAERVLLEPAHDDGVDLDRVEAEGERGVDAGERLLQATQAGDAGELIGVERVERDVDAVEPGVTQLGRQARQQGAVRGEGDVLDLGNGADLADERDDAVAHQRFAAGEADPPDALLRDEADEARDLLGREQLIVSARGHALGGHAVDAAVVALICYGDAQVGDAAPVFVVKVVGCQDALPSQVG